MTRFVFKIISDRSDEIVVDNVTKNKHFVKMFIASFNREPEDIKNTPAYRRYKKLFYDDLT